MSSATHAEGSIGGAGDRREREPIRRRALLACVLAGVVEDDLTRKPSRRSCSWAYSPIVLRPPVCVAGTISATGLRPW